MINRRIFFDTSFHRDDISNIKMPKSLSQLTTRGIVFQRVWRFTRHIQVMLHKIVVRATCSPDGTIPWWWYALCERSLWNLFQVLSLFVCAYSIGYHLTGGRYVCRNLFNRKRRQCTSKLLKTVIEVTVLYE